MLVTSVRSARASTVAPKCHGLVPAKPARRPSANAGRPRPGSGAVAYRSAGLVAMAAAQTASNARDTFGVDLLCRKVNSHRFTFVKYIFGRTALERGLARSGSRKRIPPRLNSGRSAGPTSSHRRLGLLRAHVAPVWPTTPTVGVSEPAASGRRAGHQGFLARPSAASSSRSNGLARPQSTTSVSSNLP